MTKKKDEDKLILSSLHRLRSLTKYGIVCMAVFFGVHNALMLAGIDHYLLHLTGVIFLFGLGWQLSTLFRLCWLHKMCVMYICAIIAMLLHESYMQCSVLVEICRYALVSVGMFLAGAICMSQCPSCKDAKN